MSSRSTMGMKGLKAVEEISLKDGALIDPAKKEGCIL